MPTCLGFNPNPNSKQEKVKEEATLRAKILDLDREVRKYRIPRGSTEEVGPNCFTLTLPKP